MSAEVESGETRLPRLLTLREVSQATGIQLWRWYAMIKCGQGPAVIRIGNTYRCSETAVMQWIEQQSNINRKEGEK